MGAVPDMPGVWGSSPTCPVMCLKEKKSNRPPISLPYMNYYKTPVYLFYKAYLNIF